MNKNNTLKGIPYMILNSFALSLIYTLMNQLSINFNSSQVVFFYKFCCLIITLPWVFSEGIAVLKTQQIKLHVLRGLFSAYGSLLFMYSLQYVKVVNATALSYLEQVLWTVIAVVFFKEKFHFSKFMAIIFSFLGALVIIYPNLIIPSFPFINTNITLIENCNKYYGFTFLAVLSWTANTISVKILGKKAKNKTQVFYSLLFSALFAFPVAFLKWEYFGDIIIIPKEFISCDLSKINLTDLLYFIIIVLCYIIHSIAFFQAIKKTNMSILAPYHYLNIIFVGIIGCVFFNQSIDNNACLGYIMIISSGIFLIGSKLKKDQ